MFGCFYYPKFKIFQNRCLTMSKINLYEDVVLDESRRKKNNPNDVSNNYVLQ